jgi:hypothetical protein
LLRVDNTPEESTRPRRLGARLARGVLRFWSRTIAFAAASAEEDLPVSESPLAS